MSWHKTTKVVAESEGELLLLSLSVQPVNSATTTIATTFFNGHTSLSHILFFLPTPSGNTLLS